MLHFVQGDLLESDVVALVNSVNTEGVMGKGIALQFKEAYPDNYRAYQRACKSGEVRPGHMFTFDRGFLFRPRYIINFPTKRHWRDRSLMADIENGLESLIAEVRQLGIESIALPPLGCGLGGLSWQQVRSRIETVCSGLPDVLWLVFEPSVARAATKTTGNVPMMTRVRAALIELMRQYLLPGFDYPITHLELQKLLYFLVEAGEALPKVQFVKLHYGPYADALRHVLGQLNDHYIAGYIDSSPKPDTPIHLLPHGVVVARDFLTNYPETIERSNRVAKLIEGFETPLGMELLATVHWVTTREGAQDAQQAFQAIQSWNTRKANLMTQEQVDVAWQRLRELGWLPGVDDGATYYDSAIGH